jgi:hypothetical protein
MFSNQGLGERKTLHSPIPTPQQAARKFKAVAGNK